MIDIFATLVFSLLVAFTVYRAIRLDRTTPWFSADDEPTARQVQENDTLR